MSDPGGGIVPPHIQVRLRLRRQLLRLIDANRGQDGCVSAPGLLEDLMDSDLLCLPEPS